MKQETYDVGLTHAEYKATGKSGTYRADLDRYFLDDMIQPPFKAVKAAEPAAF